MAVQTCLGVEGALVGNLQLVDGIVVDGGHLGRIGLISPIGPIGLIGDGGGETTEGQSHEDAVEPYLVGVDGLVPEHLVDIGAWLVLQLLHHVLDGQQVLLFWPEVVHAGHKVAGADIVEVVV